MNLIGLFIFPSCILGTLATQSSSESIRESREISGAISFTYSPYRTRSKLLSALFHLFDYTASIPDYTPSIPNYTPSVPYSSYPDYTRVDYTSRRNYYSTGYYTSWFDYTSRRPYWSTPNYTSRRPYWSTLYYTSRRPYWSTMYYTSRRPYSFIPTNTRGTEFTTRTVTGATASPTTPSTTVQSSTVQPRSSTTDVAPTKREFKVINNFIAEKIIFIGNNIFV